MSTKVFVENPEEISKRYDSAETELTNWQNLLEVAYLYTVPTRVNYDMEQGTSTNDFIFDNTATQAIPKFANNLINFVMPPNQRWMNLAVDKLFALKSNLNDDLVGKMKIAAQKTMDLIFIYINKSNLFSVAYEIFQDLCIGTAALILNEGDDLNPLKFESIPISSLIFEELGQAIFWKHKRIILRDIKKKWPEAKFTMQLDSKYESNPNDKIDLLEGIITYEQNPPSSKFYHFVMINDSKELIYERWLDYNPVTLFRWKKRPSETFGRGPVLEILNDIMLLNKMSEWFAMGIKYSAIPAYITYDSAILNPYNAYPTPGALISADFSKSQGRPPIMEIPGGEKIVNLADTIKEYRQRINDALLADPLPPQDADPRQTATAANIRHSTWLQQNSAAAERLSNEFVKPLISKIIHVLRKKTLVNDIIFQGNRISIKIDDNQVELDYVSPVIDLQNQTDLSNFDQWMQRMLQIYGQGAIVALDQAEVIEWTAEKENINLELLQPKSKIKSIINSMQSQVQQGQQQQQQQQQQPPSQNQQNPLSPSSFQQS